MGPRKAIIAVLAAILFLALDVAWASGPLAAKVEITPIKSYSAGKPLTKPDHILVYDLTYDPSLVKIDKSQEYRPRHMIKGDEHATSVGDETAKKLTSELVKQLEKTGIPVEHMAADAPQPSGNNLVVKGRFTAIRQGDKTERVVMGMGTGAADVATHIEVNYQTPQETVLISEFETNTSAAKNVGAGVPVVMGVNPAVAATKSTVGDRRKNSNADASKTADAAAQHITGAMSGLGWVKLDDKGKVVK